MPKKPSPKSEPSEVPTMTVDAHTTAGVVKVSGMPDRVWISCSITIQPVQFNSIKVEAGLASDVLPGEAPDEAYRRIWNVAGAQVSQRVAEVKKHVFPKQPTSTATY